MKVNLPRCLKASALALACVSALPAHAGGTISFGDDKSISIGFGMRTSYTAVKDAAPSGSDYSSDFNLDSVRLFISGSLNKYIKGTFNTERDANGKVQVMDAYAQFEPMPEFNIWAGRMLPPSDRANLDGPYYLNAWAYPGVVSQYPNKAVGRDDGVLAWGKVFDKKVVYSIGAFEGRNRGNTVAGLTSNQSANLLYAGRVAFNFWDPEPAPAYYTGSTYYGSANILTLGLAGMYEKDGVGSKLVKDDYSAWNADLLFETKLGAGVVTLEGAWYKYDFSVASALADVSGGVTPGDAELYGAAYLFPEKMGWGQFQPYLRYQKFKGDGIFPEVKQSDFGLNYIIDGPNAKISATWTKLEQTAVKDTDMFVLGLQVQF